MSKKKLVIIGAGNMGGAIAASLRGTDYEVTVTAHTRQTLSRIHNLCPDFHVTLDNVQAVTNADIIVLAVKPYLLSEVAHEIHNHIKRGATIISVVAAVSIDELKEMLGNHDVFRVIPNTAIRLGKSATFIAGKSEGNNIKEVEAIFNRSGKSFLIEEKDMAAVTALSSCGIAYFLRFIRAATEGAVELGLRPGFAAEVAAATAVGAAALVEDGGHPEAEIDKVATPGGLSIKGLNALAANGFTTAVIAAIKASFKP